MSGQRLQDDGLCFGCGANNRIGLHLTFEWDGDICAALWTPTREHQGWADRVHGGLLALVLDEALSRAALERHGLHWVTAELTTRLKSPAEIGERLLIQAQIVSVRPRLILCTGEVRAEAGKRLVAVATAKLMRP